MNMTLKSEIRSGLRAFKLLTARFRPVTEISLKDTARTSRVRAVEPLAKVERFCMEEVFKSQRGCSGFVIGISATAGISH